MSAVNFGCAPVVGQDLHPGIIGEDDRVILEQQGAPWDAVGKVNISTYSILGACTGTLVAPNVVITAAHCVIDPIKKSPFPLRTIHFLAGVRGSNYLGHSIARCLHFPQDYAYIGPKSRKQVVPVEAFEKDAVAIVLEDTLNVDPAPLATDVKAESGLKLVHVAYAADHLYMPWSHFNCHLLRSDLHGPLWFNDCDIHGGSSGGPVFVADRGSYKVTAVMLGGHQRLANIALPISEWRSLAMNTSCP